MSDFTQIGTCKEHGRFCTDDSWGCPLCPSEEDEDEDEDEA